MLDVGPTAINNILCMEELTCIILYISAYTQVHVPAVMSLPAVLGGPADGPGEVVTMGFSKW